MTWTDFFIKRPVFSVSLAILLVFGGLFGFTHLPLRLFPKVDTPTINISIEYPGASAETMESFIANTIENSLAGINGVDYITSASSQGHVNISIHMMIGANADVALTNIMQKVASVRGKLPQGIDEPIISKGESDDNPVLLLAFTSSSLSRAQISDYLSRAVKPQLESIDGVASADVMGSKYAMRLWLNPNAMAAYKVTMQDVVGSLKQQNIQSTVGSLDGEVQQNIVLNSALDDPLSFNQLVIKQSGDSIIRLKDVGKATLGNATDKISAFYNGKEAVMVSVKPETGANPLKIVGDIEGILPQIKQQLPNGLHLHTVVNAATYIHASIEEVVKTIIEAVAVVAIVIFLFLGSLLAVLIPLITIPLSLISVCFLLMLMGYSINLLTLLAMVIAIGLVVDDAIVVMENIHRYIEEGYSVLKAALIGTREIAFSVIAMSLTLAIVFMPIVFSGGLTGKLFAEFSWTLAGAVILSGVIALTLSPMMCAKTMCSISTESRFVQVLERFFDGFKNIYIVFLEKVFKYKKIVLVIWLLSVSACIYFYSSTPKEIAPKEDEGILLVIGSVPDSASTQLLERNSSKLNAIYHSVPEIESANYINGIPSEHQVLSFVRLKPWGERKLSSLELQPLLQAKLNQIAGLQSVAVVPDVLPGLGGLPVQFVIKSMGSYKDLYVVVNKIIQAARKSGLFLFVNDDLNYDQPVLKIDIDRKAALAMGVSIDDIVQTLSIALNENKVQYFDLSGRSYEVIPQIYVTDRLNPEQLDQLYVKARGNKIVPLSALVSLKTEVEPAVRNQFQKFNAVTLSGVMSPGHTLSEGLKFLNEAAKKILPPVMHTDYSGNSRQMIQEGNHMLWLFLSAFIVVFIVLAMQFESFKDPLIILAGSLPMALMAAMFPLKFGFATINIYTQIGLITLAGLISKHGILLVKFANNEKSKGSSKYDAIIQACTTRFRPILMTTLAIIFGVLPLVFATGAGAISRFDIGIVIFSGMFLGTLFTLFVVPVLYYFLSGSRHLKS